MKAVERSGEVPAEAPRRTPARAQAGPRVGPAVLQGLQGRVGNAAVARMVAVQRLADGSRPVPPPGLTAADDPRFRGMAAGVGRNRAALTRHPSGKAAAKAAQDAAVAPADDKEAQAKAARVGEMGTAKAAPFDKAAFVAAVNQAIAAQAPRTLDDAASFASSGKADAVKGQVTGQVTAGRQASAKDIADKTAAPPDPSVAAEKPVTPLPPQPAPPAPAPPDPKAAAVAPAPDGQTDLSEGPRRTDARMTEAELTPEQLARSNEPQFTQALEAKKAADEHARTAPARYRAGEAARIRTEQAAAGATGTAGAQEMAAAHTGASARAATGQGAAKAREEAARAAVSTEIKGVFDTTKVETEKILADLDGEVESAFDKGEKAAKDVFTADHKARMERYKDERYSGLLGAGRWLEDLVLDLPPEANQIFLTSRALYEQRMQQVVSDIADLIGRRLGEATARIAKGRQDVAAIVARQPPQLRQFAGQAAQSIGGDFDQLDASVGEKSQNMVQDLAQRYTAARGELDEEIKALQAENKGLLSKAEDALVETARTVLQLKDMLLGVLARAAGALGRIIAAPVEFLGNLVTAVKGGVTGFAERIGDHLKNGLKDWLFGQLAAGGIEIPEELDAKGIVKLVLSVLGLTWNSIRARVVAAIGEPAMRHLESAFDMVKVLVTEGVAGLWRWISGKLADLKDTVVGAIEDFVVEKIVTAGITWIVSLLNPASAFVRACKAIYDVVMFFVHRASQIKSFVDSVLDSVESIAAGGAGGVPALIENSLARAVPVVLDFLAGLLGLGGVSDKIRSVLQKVQAPVMKAVDWVIAKIMAAGRKVLAKLKARAQGGDDSPEGKQQRLDRGMAAARAAADRFAGRRVGARVIEPLFGLIRTRYGLTELKVVPQSGKWAIEGAVNPRAVQLTGVIALEDPMEAAALFARTAAEVETEFFATGNAPGALIVRGAREQQLAGSYGRRGVPALGGTAVLPAGMAGTSSAEFIQSRLGVAQAHAQATNGRGLPRFATTGTDFGHGPLTEMVNPSRAQPMNSRINQVGAYGDANASPGDGSVMGVVNSLRAAGMSDAGISAVMAEHSRTGLPITRAQLRAQGYRGDGGTIRSGSTQMPPEAALAAVTHLTHRVEPLRFLERGPAQAQQPVATTTAMAHALVQGGAVPLQDVLAGNARLGPAAQAPQGNEGTIAQSNVKITMLVEQVRRTWSDWVRTQNQHIVAEAQRAGIADPHLVPTRDAMRAMLRRFYGEARVRG